MIAQTAAPSTGSDLIPPDEATGPSLPCRGVGPSAMRTSASDVSGWSRRGFSDVGRAKALAELPRILSGLALTALHRDMLLTNSRNRAAPRGSGLGGRPLPDKNRHAAGN